MHSARISTLGEQAEDIFNITLDDDQLLDDVEKQAVLKEALQERLKGEDTVQ